MSQYYNPERKDDWNYGGKNWKLSRSKIELFLECPRCFYIDNKLGIKRPPGYPFNLNSAVDSLLKQEFDVHRAKGQKHPLQKEYKINAVPAQHEKLDEWRTNFIGVQFFHEPTNMTVSGAIDDLWVNTKGEHFVVDYKATAKADDITELNSDWHIGYKRQMEVYQWLLRQNGLKVSDTGYFVYCNGIADAKAFDKKLEFRVEVIPYVGDAGWVEDTIRDIHKCLKSKKIPAANPDCDYCNYRDAVEKKLK